MESLDIGSTLPFHNHVVRGDNLSIQKVLQCGVRFDDLEDCPEGD